MLLKDCFGNGRKHCGKGRKCWLLAFSPFPTMFSKGFLYMVFKIRDSVVRGKAYFAKYLITVFPLHT